MALAAGNVGQIGVAADQAAKELIVAGESGVVAGQEITAGMQMGRREIREAKGEAALLGEAFGIHLPRHVRGFVAELPGVGTALQAAFSATAVLFLIQALVQGAEKLSNWISDTFIFTEAMKKANEAIVKFNKEMLDLNAQMAKAQAAFDEFGLKGTAKVAHDMDTLSLSIYKNEDALNALKDQIYGYTHGLIQMSLEDLKAAKNAAEDKKQILVKTLQEQQLEMGLLQKEYDAADKDEREKAAKDAEKAAKEHSKIMIAYQKEEFETSLKYITEQREALEAAMAAVVAMATGMPAPAVLAQNTLGGITQSALDAQAAADQLGVSLGATLVVALNAARKAYQDLSRSGVASAHDLALAQMHVLQLQLEVNKAMGDVSGVKKTEQEISNLTNRLKVMEGQQLSTIKLKPNWDKFFDDIINKSRTTGQAIKELGQLTADGIGESVAAAVSGSASFGQAMEHMLKSALAALAGHAVVKALEELAYAASDLANPLMAWHATLHFHAAAMWGAIGAAAAVAGAAIPGGSSARGSSAPSGTTNPVSTPAGIPGAQPSQTMNVPHLAAGALITAPTLALVGDRPGGGARPEAVIPLDDPRAMRQLAGALGEYLGQGGAGGTVNHIYNGAILDVNKLLRLQSQHVQRGKGRSLASNSYRTTKRS